MGKATKKGDDPKFTKKEFELRNKNIGRGDKSKDKMSRQVKEPKNIPEKKTKVNKPTIRQGVKGGPKVIGRKKNQNVCPSEDNESEADVNEEYEISDVEEEDIMVNDQNVVSGDVSGDGTPSEEDLIDMEDDEEEGQAFSKIGEKDKKTRKKWSKKMEENLCTLWEEESHMYDATCIDYRKSHLRAAALRRFAVILKISVDEVKLHMETLRTSYRKLLSLPSGSSADRLTPRQQEIVELCGFLKKHLQNRESKSNLPKPKQRNKVKCPAKVGTKQQSQKKTQQGIHHSDVSDSDMDDVEKTVSRNTSKRKIADGENTENANESDSEPAYYITSKRKKANENKRKADLSSAMRGRNEILTNLTSSLSNLSQRNISQEKCDEQKDSYDLWAKLLAEKLRKMDDKSAERFKVHVDTLALDAMESEWFPKDK